MMSQIANSEFYVWFVAVTRGLSVILGAALAGTLMKAARKERATMQRTQFRAVTALIINALNISFFTALVLIDKHPTFPASLIAVGWDVSFFYMFRALSFRKQDNPL